MKPVATPSACSGDATLLPEDVAQFRALVWNHYRQFPRNFLWRVTRDPYEILVSEFMLQQTGVERVVLKYAEFLALFPDVTTLARAPLAAVLSAWQGLGYNRRAVALHRTAQTLVEHHGATVPDDVAALEGLPGIGPYTARAIAAFAFDQPTVFVETNIRAVFIHHFCGDRDGVKDRELLSLIVQTLDRQDSRHWYYALMDYGAALKKLHANPSRRSAHHVRQSPFKGSNRELRSRILQAILAAPGLSANELIPLVGAPPERIGTNLTRLEREGFILARGERFFIR